VAVYPAPPLAPCPVSSACCGSIGPATWPACRPQPLTHPAIRDPGR
jgi:hypothetical protein